MEREGEKERERMKESLIANELSNTDDYFLCMQP